jgi:hypothetical protein
MRSPPPLGDSFEIPAPEGKMIDRTFISSPALRGKFPCTRREEILHSEGSFPALGGKKSCTLGEVPALLKGAFFWILELPL